MAPSVTTIQHPGTYRSRSYTDKWKLIGDDNGDRGKISRVASKEAINDVLKEQIAKVDVNSCDPGEENAFYVADLGEVYRQHMRWKTKLGRVRPFYAVKCNPDDQVLRLLAALGTGFDCASHAEIEKVLKLGVDPSRIIYAQPCKNKSFIRYAAQVGVRQMTFDNADELRKIATFYPSAELLLRISTDDSASLCRLSAKFGASIARTQGLLELAKEMGLNVIGISFHIGSGASDPGSFKSSVRDARTVFDQAAAVGFDLKLLDVGGGFISDTFEIFADALTSALDAYFPPHIRVIGEPGRYYVADAFSLATNVIARRDVEDPVTGEQAYMLYLNDGVYGNFSNIIFDHQHPTARILQCSEDVEKTTVYSIWGQTCDGIDVINERCTLPSVVNVDDWLVFDQMGAYTKCSATRFNGFSDNHRVVYVASEQGALALLGY